MKLLFALLVTIVLLGGGYYGYSSMQTPVAVTPVVENMNTTPTVPTTPILPAATSTKAVKEFIVTNAGMTFTTKTLTVKKGDPVKITYKNAGGTHDLRIEGYNVGTKVLAANQEESFEFIADTAGSFEYYCSVGSHRANGMFGTLTVTE